MMPKDCQRDMIVLTNMAMKPHSLTIGGILPLNLDSFVMVIAIRWLWKTNQPPLDVRHWHTLFLHFQIAKKMYSLIVVLRQVVS